MSSRCAGRMVTVIGAGLLRFGRRPVPAGPSASPSVPRLGGYRRLPTHGTACRRPASAWTPPTAADVEQLLIRMRDRLPGTGRIPDVTVSVWGGCRNGECEV